MLTFACFKKVAAGAASKFCPEPELYHIDAAPQHCKNRLLVKFLLSENRAESFLK
jgi:hypothetical protein